jgi:FtsP/CotA-like multicopper oxidase with cupredoxin domain
LTFINPGGFEALKVSIDGHKMWVYGVDGGYVVPQMVDQVVVNNGDRYSVMVELNQPTAQYSIRVANAGLNQVISGFAVLSYKGSVAPATTDPNALSTMNYAGGNTTNVVVFNDNKAAPYPPHAPALTADKTYLMNIHKLDHPYTWSLSGVNAFVEQLEDQSPLLYENPAKVKASDLILKTNNGTWVDLIVRTQGPLAQPHPMHKHSNKAFVLGKGIGDWNWSSVAEAAAVLPNNTFNFKNPPLRDGVSLLPHSPFAIFRLLTLTYSSPLSPTQQTIPGWHSATKSSIQALSFSTVIFRPMWQVVWQSP